MQAATGTLMSPVGAEATLEAAQSVADQLHSQGLAYRVPGGEEWSLVAAQHASAFFCSPAAPGGTKGPPQEQGLRQVLLQPWLDPQGGVNRELFEALARRAISAAIRTPGEPAGSQLLTQKGDRLWNVRAPEQGATPGWGLCCPWVLQEPALGGTRPSGIVCHVRHRRRKAGWLSGQHCDRGEGNLPSWSFAPQSQALPWHSQVD